MSSRPTVRPTSSARISQARAADTSRRSALWIGGVVVLVIAIALGIAIVATRSSTSTVALKGGGTVVPAGELAYGDVTVTGSNLPAQAAGSAADPAVGQVAPAITGEQFDGSSLTIPSTGKPKVVMFVAHWCPHCQKEVPLIGSYLAANGLPTDVDLYTVATSTSDQQANFPPSKWLNKEGWPVRTIADDGKGTAANAYGVSGFPYFVVVGADGKVIERTSGELTLEQFQKLVDDAKR